MDMHWREPMILPLKGGRLHIQSAVIMCDQGERIDGHAIEAAAIRRIKRDCGPERAAWGKIEVDYVRKKCVPGTDMVHATLAVVVHVRATNQQPAEPVTDEGDQHAE